MLQALDSQKSEWQVVAALACAPNDCAIRSPSTNPNPWPVSLVVDRSVRASASPRLWPPRRADGPSTSAAVPRPSRSIIADAASALVAEPQPCLLALGL